MKPQFIFLLFFFAVSFINAQTDTASTGKHPVKAEHQVVPEIPEQDTAKPEFRSSLLYLKTEFEKRFPVKKNNPIDEFPDIARLSYYFFSQDELNSGLTPDELFYYRKNKDNLMKILNDYCTCMGNNSLGKLGEYLEISKKTAAIILAIIHLLTF